MDQKEINLWKLVDVGGYAAISTLLSFSLEGIKTRVEKDDLDFQEYLDKINDSFKKLYKRYDEINLNLLDQKKFPVHTLRKIKSGLLPEMERKFKELNSLIKHFLSGASYFKLRVTNKIKDCQGLLKQMNELGQEFSKNDRYWEYRETKPKRVYLDITPPDQSGE